MPEKLGLQCDPKDNFSNASVFLLHDSWKEAEAGAAEKRACSLGTRAKVKDQLCKTNFLFDVNNL